MIKNHSYTILIQIIPFFKIIILLLLNPVIVIAIKTFYLIIFLDLLFMVKYLHTYLYIFVFSKKRLDMYNLKNNLLKDLKSYNALMVKIVEVISRMDVYLIKL